ncbi:MAG: PQQ-binding-like beta-propeller repeat protein [Gammaproteobacteria bacterium]|nr:PQQ-binding-like beta-propeller repeat protein [Gammaproteobacteria bacterium]
MNDAAQRRPRAERYASWLFVLVVTGALAWQAPLIARAQDAPIGEWRNIAGDAAATRYLPVDQINADNFSELEVAWVWRGDNFGPGVDYLLRSTPIYVDGLLYTVAGQRRTVGAIDPATGETVWTYREPHTTRYERGMRNNYGKGVAYAEINGRDVIFTTSPGFFLHAMDAKTGRPLEDWGAPVPVEGFPRSGVVDMLPDLVSDWEPWLTSGYSYDPEQGIPKDLGNVSTSSPPIVVNGVIIVGNVHEQGYYQTRTENIPGDILAYDLATGEFLWKFHVIPRPGELGHDTWENDAWQRTGDVSSWAPMSADPERGIVYIPTNPPTLDFYGGFRPGDNLFGTSVLALDVQTGERLWHFQTVHHDVWNWDNPAPPILLDVEIDGQPTPIAVETVKQGFAFTFNRVTGEPIWPIEERPVPQSDLPGEKLSPTQPFPTWPAPFEMQGLSEDDLIDFTPALRREAIEIVKDYRIEGLYTPPMQRDHPSGLLAFVNCPSGAGGSNIFGPTSSDPETGVIFVSTLRSCGTAYMVPGTELDEPDDIMTTGETISPWLVSGRRRLQGPEGLPIFKPPYSSIVAIDMNTGEHLWSVPNGDTPDQIKNHPALEGLDIPNTGRRSHAILLTTSTLLITAEGGAGAPLLHAIDKATGERVGSVEMPAQGRYGMMGYLHDGQQYIVVQISSPDHPGSLAALRLP